MASPSSTTQESAAPERKPEGGGLQPPASSLQPLSPPQSADPYARIEQALARIRTDVPPPSLAGGDESRRPTDAGPTTTPDHDDAHDHDDARAGRRKETGNG